MSNRKKRYLGIALITASVIASVHTLSRKPHTEQRAAEKSPQNAAALKRALAQLEAISTETARQRLANMQPAPVPKPAGRIPREALGAMQTSYREMLAVQGLYNQNTARRQLVDQILKSPYGLEIASKSLVDPGFVRTTFGDLQAEARVFSIQVLKEAARQGNEQHLTQSADAISAALARTSSASKELDTGRSADLRDLVRAYIDVKGTEAFASGDARLVKALGYDKALPADVKGIYDEAVFVRLKREYGRESAVAMTSALLEG